MKMNNFWIKDEIPGVKYFHPYVVQELNCSSLKNEFDV